MSHAPTIELACAAQAVDLRGIGAELGTRTTAAHDQVRRSVPYVVAGRRVPADYAPLIAWLTKG